MTSAAAPPAEETQRPLSESITTATRSVHAKLNKLIIARLPLAIPPRSADPSVYVSGLLHIAPIYITFESLWETIAKTPPRPSGLDESQGESPKLGNHLIDLNGPSPASKTGPVLKHSAALCERTRSILTSLYLPGLMRSGRLRSDIGSVTGWSPEVVDEQLKAVSESGQLAEFTKHVKRTIERKPHVLLAYSYILFMALFAGGRFIRATLESAGSDFWERVPSPIPPAYTRCQPRSPSVNAPIAVVAESVDLLRGERGTIEIGTKHSRHSLPLSFFHFATVLDGEDLKKEFKKRLAESENLLTPRERHDVIQEAVCIFDNMLLLVGQLDNVCDTNLENGSSVMASWASLAPKGRLRDSLAIARERQSEKAAPRESDDSEKSDSWFSKHPGQKSSEAAELSYSGDSTKQPPTCCPASRSMRFEAKLPVPDRKAANQPFSTNGVADVPSVAGSAISRSAITFMTNIILVAGLAAIVSMFFLAGTPADKGPDSGRRVVDGRLVAS